MQILVEQIPNGSHGLSIFHEGVDPETADIEAVIRLDNMGDGQCKARGAKGSLSDETNIAVGLKAIELGYEYMLFKVVRGTKVSRRATYLYSDKTYDWHGVDLIAAKEAL